MGSLPLTPSSVSENHQVLCWEAVHSCEEKGDSGCVRCPLREIWALPSAPGPWRVMACPLETCPLCRPWGGWDQRHTYVRIEGLLVCLPHGGHCVCSRASPRSWAVTFLTTWERALSLPRLPHVAFVHVISPMLR